MKTSDWITIWAIVTGLVATTVGSTVVLSFKIGGVHEKVMSMEKTLDKVSKEDIPRIDRTINEMKVDIAGLTFKVDELWSYHTSKVHSPRVLNDHGLHILKLSHMDQFAGQHYEEILKKVKAANPTNAYQVQALLFPILKEYNTELNKQQLEAASSASGYSVPSLLWITAVYIRPKITIDLNIK